MVARLPILEATATSFSVRAVSVLGLMCAIAVHPPSIATAEPTDPGFCDPVDLGSANSCAGQPPQTWPVPEGNFTSPDDPGWIFFKPFHLPAGYTGPKADAMRSVQYGCGIGPDGTVGCDHVPTDPWGGGGPGCGDYRCPPPPPGTNQTVAGPQQPGEYVRSDTLTFTRDVDDLPEGHRLVNGDAWCAVGFQGSVSCTSGANGFTLAWWGGILEQ